MKSKLLEKVTTMLLILTMTFSYWGVLVNKVYAEYELESQEVATNNKNVEFNMYFKVDDENVHTIDCNKNENGNLYANFGVKNGYLKNISVKMDNPNFSMQNENSENEESEDEIQNNGEELENQVQENEIQDSGEDLENQVQEIENIENEEIDSENIKNEIFEIDGSEIKLTDLEDQQEIEIPIYFEKAELIDADYFSKETVVKFTAIYVDQDGEENAIEAERKILVNWKEDVIVDSEQKIEKVIDLGSGRFLLQTNLKVRVRDNSVPAKTTKIEILNPVIENVEIETAKLYAINTVMSNGVEDSSGLTVDNWQYNQEEGKITVNIENQKTEDGKINWKDGEDEFKLIYVLNSLDGIINEKAIELKVTGEIGYNNTVVPFENVLQENLVPYGKLIDMSYYSIRDMNKGYMYAKSEETGYETKVVAEVSYSEWIEYLDIEMGQDTFVLENGSILNTNAIVYKSTIISKSNFDTLFGEEGRIEIYGNGNKVAEINKESTANEEGNIVINYEEVNSLEIITSKPIVEGKLEIKNKKAIKAETEYDIETLKEIKEIETKAIVKTNMTEEEKSGRIRLNETVSKAEITMLTENLSTVVKNESVEMRVLFRTNSNMYDLYKNPEIEIELPSQIKEVELKSIEAAFGEGFNLNWYDIIENEEGKKVIRIALTGEQVRHAIDISEGMSLTIKADMTLDKKSGSSEEVVVLRYRNEKAIGYDNEGIAEGKVRIEAPTGVVAINSIDIEGSISTSLSSREQTGELEILTDKKLATMTIDVINNYGEEIVNPSIIGRVPYEGNKKETGEELGSTFTANLIRGIEKQAGLENANYKVYYSSNGEATEDLNNEENGWKESIEEAGEIKSYLIQAEGYKMAQGELMSFNYEVEIPEGLNHNESAYGTYAVNYGIEESEGLREEKIIAPTVGTTTGAGPVLEVSLEADVENEADVEEGEMITYAIKIKNTGDADAKNVKITANIPDAVVYTKSSSLAGKVEKVTETIEDENGNTIEKTVRKYSLTTDSILAGETYTIYLSVTVEPILENNVEDNLIEMIANISADDLDKTLSTNKYTNKRVKGNVTIELESLYEEDFTLITGDKFYFTIRVTNVTYEDKNNVIIKYNIPEGLDYIDALINNSGEETTEGIEYDPNTRSLICRIDKLESRRNMYVKVNVKASAFEGDIYERTMESKASVITDGMDKEKVSNTITNISGRPKLVAIQTSNRDKYINSTEKIEYYIEIENIGKAVAKQITLTDYLPKELKYKKATCEINGKTFNGYAKDNIITISTNIKAGEKVVVTIVAEGIKQDKEEVEITNRVTIGGGNTEDIEVNSLTHTLRTNDKVVTQDGSLISVYTISGTAWEDTNKDGKKGTGESKISNLEVILVNSDTGVIAKKAIADTEQRTVTNVNGDYTFTEVTKGNYIVIFLYNSNQYNITECKKTGVSDSDNSDAIKTQIKFNDNLVLAGVTENILVENARVSGVNIGLIKMESAIFAIDKVVTKIVMTNPKTSRTAEYKDSKLAKMDVDAKYINSTNLVMEYKIRVTNQGSVDGYVKKIVDNVPSQFKFSTDLNTQWYLGSNGEIYNTSLANTLIQPGETKEVTLVLTKKMTESGNGIVHNTSEIVEVYNEYGLENIINNDSTRGAADVVIAIKTGNAVTYISLIFIIIGIIGIGVYFINKKVAKKIM